MEKLIIFRESNFPSVFCDGKILEYLEVNYSNDFKKYSKMFNQEINERLMIFNNLLIVLEKIITGLFFLALNSLVMNYSIMSLILISLMFISSISFLYIKRKIKNVSLYGDFANALFTYM